MADILSFSKARKAKARAEKEQTAAENRVKFGRSKAEKRRDAAIEAQEKLRLDGARRTDDEPRDE
jgi:hypothetical protein